MSPSPNIRSTTVTDSELTPVPPVYSLDSPENHTAASLLTPSGCCYSGPDVSDGRGWTSELRPENHSWSLTNCSSSIWIKNKRWNDWWSIRCVEVWNVSWSMSCSLKWLEWLCPCVIVDLHHVSLLQTSSKRQHNIQTTIHVNTDQ